MTRQKITTVNNTAALLLTPDMLDQMGISIGDDVEVTLVDRALILRPLAEVEREQAIAALTQALLERRRCVYTALAEGPPT
jgi:antitoxin component of MazEF toxin-antitoxin module